jgi:hypothetical protein
VSQAIGVLLRNRLYAGIVDVPEYGVRAKHGDFEPLISEELSTASKRFSRVVCQARHRGNELIPTFRYVASFVVIPADVA